MRPAGPAGRNGVVNPPPGRRVAVHKRDWLPPSETFLRNQTDACTRWEVECTGFRRVESALARESDVILEGPEDLRDRWSATPPDLVHVHWATEAIDVLPVVRQLRMPLVVTVHGMDVTRALRWPGTRGDRARTGVPQVLRAADAVVAPSHFLAGRAAAAGAPSESIRVLPIGIPVPERVAREPDVDLIFVGRLIPLKGGVHLVRCAAAAAQALGRPVTVRVIGDGPERAAIERTAAELDVPLDLTGLVPPQDVPGLMASGRVFVGLSRVDEEGAREGFGMTFREAAAQARPVVAYDSGGVGEAVQHGVTGLLAAEGHEEEAARHVVRLLGDGELRTRMGEAGRVRVERSFDIARRTAALEDLYDTVAAGARRWSG